MQTHEQPTFAELRRAHDRITELEEILRDARAVIERTYLRYTLHPSEPSQRRVLEAIDKAL
jgi:hypothetical protein